MFVCVWCTCLCFEQRRTVFSEYRKPPLAPRGSTLDCEIRSSIASSVKSAWKESISRADRGAGESKDILPGQEAEAAGGGAEDSVRNSLL